MGAEGTDLWCTCGVCLSASVLSAREGVREGSLRVLQLGRCGAGGIEGTARILRPCFLCARGGGLHVVSCCSVRGMACAMHTRHCHRHPPHTHTQTHTHT